MNDVLLHKKSGFLLHTLVVRWIVLYHYMRLGSKELKGEAHG